MSNVPDTQASAKVSETSNRLGIASYALLLVPVGLFLASLYFRPTMYSDSGFGFLVLQSMLKGGAFNFFTTPDPANISNDIATFQSWWSPGQYLVPGAFVWLGSDYGLALALTSLLSTVAGVIGWAKAARSWGASPFVLFLFLLGLVTFRYATLPFRIYTGGEVLLFAATPWCLYWLQNALSRPPVVCFAITLISGALLFTAKLTGLIAFASSVAAIVLLEFARQRRLSVSICAMLTACGVGAILFQVFWVSHGSTPGNGTGFAVTWPAIWFPVAATAVSGISGYDIISRLLLYPSAPILSDITQTTYVLGPIGLLLMAWVWHRLRNTQYREVAVALFTVIAFYMAALVFLYLRQATVSFEERHFRYPGILLFLLALIALEQQRSRAANAIAIAVVAALSSYGLLSYAVGVRELASQRNYDAFSGTTQHIVSPRALEYLRSEMAAHRWTNAIAVVPSPEAAVALTGFRIIALQLDFTTLAAVASRHWAGRAEKIFVIVQEPMIGNGKAEALLKSFAGYDASRWAEKRIDGMIVYTQ